MELVPGTVFWHCGISSVSRACNCNEKGCNEKVPSWSTLLSEWHKALYIYCMLRVSSEIKRFLEVKLHIFYCVLGTLQTEHLKV